MNSMVNWERIDIQFCDSSGGLRDMMDAMRREREMWRIQQQSEGLTHNSSIKRNSREGLRTS